MTYVVCILMGIPYPGIVVETQGDQWLVEFKIHTQWINSNNCEKKKK